MGAHPSQCFRRPLIYILVQDRCTSVAQHNSFSVFQDLLLFRSFRAQIQVRFFNSGPWSHIDCVRPIRIQDLTYALAKLVSLNV